MSCAAASGWRAFRVEDTKRTDASDDDVDLIYISQVDYISVLGVLKDHELKRSYRGNPLWFMESQWGLPEPAGHFKGSWWPRLCLSLITAGLCLSDGADRTTHALQNHPFPCWYPHVASHSIQNWAASICWLSLCKCGNSLIHEQCCRRRGTSTRHVKIHMCNFIHLQSI